ncbi:acetyltransferase [Duganella sp. Leaf126]|uniref:GNAT family N-acetyltransferase n=1 Tax=Duganella sp. Leaf126 TaxID=1736266 RepID=UPI0006FE05DD|nr:GNAT family N-acetyltransferase [Duganella sp. Leaf126]KQQ32431.1 acetyltransferase [Duganella sp. Leaf126]
MAEAYTVRALDADQTRAAIAPLAAVLLDCVAGGASVSFMAPMAPATATDFWQAVADGVAHGERTLIVAEDALGIAGTVQLITGMPENQPHRADVAKLLVHRRARNSGVGLALMRCVEEAARAQHKTLLVLDTASPGAARLYERLGWQRVGSVPNYALLPDGALCDTTFFYKAL